jgi:hypothetical protein
LILLLGFRVRQGVLRWTALALFGVTFAQIALGVLGVLSTAGEYSSGMIRSPVALAIFALAPRAIIAAISVCHSHKNL